MEAREPFITDPNHLAEAAGRASLCLRPRGRVSVSYRRVQERLRLVAEDDPGSWPAAHVSLKSFGTLDRRLDDDVERRVVALVEEWARETPKLGIETDGAALFADDLIPIIRIRRTPDLFSAFADIRARARSHGFRGEEERIDLDDWIFHMSVVYYEGDRWPEIETEMRNISVPPTRCVVDHAELVSYDGGPERLLGQFPLFG